MVDKLINVNNLWVYFCILSYVNICLIKKKLCKERVRVMEGCVYYVLLLERKILI